MTLKSKKNLSYVISRLLSRGVPVFSVFFIYGIFEEVEATQRLTGMSILAVGFTVLLFYKDLKEMADRLVESQWKHAIQEGRLFVIFLVILLFIQWAKSGIFEIERLVFILAISQGLAIYPASLHKKYLTIYKKEKEKSDE